MEVPMKTTDPKAFIIIIRYLLKALQATWGISDDDLGYNEDPYADEDLPEGAKALMIAQGGTINPAIGVINVKLPNRRVKV